VERHVLINYEECAKYEKKKFGKGYIVLKEYEDFYLCGKVDENNKVMYRECFSKFDIDGVPETPRGGHPFWKGMIIKNTNKKKRWFQW
jgi:hypothetical protein